MTAVLTMDLNPVPFEEHYLKTLYPSPKDYSTKFNARLDQLVEQRWLLAEDAKLMKA